MTDTGLSIFRLSGLEVKVIVVPRKEGAGSRLGNNQQCVVSRPKASISCYLLLQISKFATAICVLGLLAVFRSVFWSVIRVVFWFVLCILVIAVAILAQGSYNGQAWP